MVHADDDLAPIVVAALEASGESLRAGDVLAIAQKIVSKAEGRAVGVASMVSSQRAHAIVREVGKDLRVAEHIMGEAKATVPTRCDLLVVEHRLRFVTANAGHRHSNVAQGGDDDTVLLLAADPDAPCALLRSCARATDWTCRW